MSRKVAVIGDFILDHYYYGQAHRLSPEAPVPVVLVNNEKYILGGAGNVVRNLCSFGLEVFASGFIGNDSSGTIIIELLKKEGVDVNNLVIGEDILTPRKSRVISDFHHIVRLDSEEYYVPMMDLQKILINNLTKVLKEVSILVVSDYGKGTLTDFILETIITICNSNDIKVIVDPKGKDFKKYSGSFLVTPNKLEASLATGINIVDQRTRLLALNSLKDILENNHQLITLGHEGIVLFTNGAEQVYPALARDVIDVTGAGDTVIAAIAFQLALGHTVEEALIFANIAASIVVQKSGSAVVSLNEINEFTSSQHREKIYYSKDEFLGNYSDIKLGRKIVFTNGCFDILHRGHIDYLTKAKSFGDLLILGLNSDSSIRRLKGENRPINNQEDRAALLAALEVVDYVVLFDEETPDEILKKIVPDVLVKGGDYEISQILGREHAKEVIVIELTEGKSTTSVISNILLKYS